MPSKLIDCSLSRICVLQRRSSWRLTRPNLGRPCVQPFQTRDVDQRCFDHFFEESHPPFIFNTPVPWSRQKYMYTNPKNNHGFWMFRFFLFHRIIGILDISRYIINLFQHWPAILGGTKRLRLVAKAIGLQGHVVVPRWRQVEAPLWCLLLVSPHEYGTYTIEIRIWPQFVSSGL